MPKDDDITRPQPDDKIRHKPTEVDDRDTDGRRHSYDRHRTNWLPIALLSILGALLLVGVGAGIDNVLTHQRQSFPGSRSGITTYIDDGQHMMRHRFVYGGPQTQTVSRDIISGVVTSVSGNNFTVGGRGNQYTVKTTTDTTYNNNSKKVSVNDSVIVIGQLNDKTIDAKDVKVINY